MATRKSASAKRAKRPTMKIRSNDRVKVTGGKDRGKTGKVLRVEPAKQRVYVEGLNMVKRHQRPLPGRPNMPVGVIEKEGAIHVSNVAILDPETNKPTRIGVRRDGERRMRYTKRSNRELD